MRREQANKIVEDLKIAIKTDPMHVAEQIAKMPSANAAYVTAILVRELPDLDRHTFMDWLGDLTLCLPHITTSKV